MKRVVGVGGIFFKAKNPKALKAWYAKYLGFDIDEYGTMFSFANEENPMETGFLQWSTFAHDTNHFEPSQKEFMINYRVADLTKLVEVLTKEGVVFLDEMATYSYGKFIHLLDPEGNKIELWEPVIKPF